MSNGNGLHGKTFESIARNCTPAAGSVVAPCMRPGQGGRRGAPAAGDREDIDAGAVRRSDGGTCGEAGRTFPGTMHAGTPCIARSSVFGTARDGPDWRNPEHERGPCVPFVLGWGGAGVERHFLLRGVAHPVCRPERDRKRAGCTGTGDAEGGAESGRRGVGGAVEKERYIHDALCGRIGYYTNDESGEAKDCAEGALLDGLADCDGYADAMVLCCGLAGIPCRYMPAKPGTPVKGRWSVPRGVRATCGIWWKSRGAGCRST